MLPLIGLSSSDLKPVFFENQTAQTSWDEYVSLDLFAFQEMKLSRISPLILLIGLLFGL